MSHLIYRASASADIRAAFEWYESQRHGLGDEFLEGLREAEQSIRASPEGFRLIHRDVRRYLLRRYPYQLLYRVMGETIVVVGCLHVRRSPRVAKDRADG